MKYFSEVRCNEKPFSRYANFDLKAYRQSISLSTKIWGVNIVHINSTAEGGGVAEMLRKQVAVEKSLGIKSRWLVLEQPNKFFAITKKIHNLLQGSKGGLSKKEKGVYLEALRVSGVEINVFLQNFKTATIVILHDPQVLPLIEFIPAHIPVVSRMHIDLSSPNIPTLNFLKPFFLKVRKVILSHKKFRPSWLSRGKIIISYPAIDPFSQKNISLKHSEIARKLTDFGLDIKYPILLQVSRFDKWKDPKGVIEAYRLAKKTFPGLQLVMEGSLGAIDDPEAGIIYDKLKAKYGNDPDLFLNGSGEGFKKYGERWVNVFQRGANVVIQKSIREGFGMTVTEALWKNKAVVGGNALGIKTQIKNGKSGYIVSSTRECARRIVELLRNKKIAERFGEKGHASVKKHFLLNRLILDFLKIYAGLQ